MVSVLTQYNEKFGTDFDLFEFADFLTVHELKEMLQCAIDECRPINFDYLLGLDP
ncbi:MAG: hypothetical protein HGB26_08740 [Desulfobulbaceae bacterium]|nr:hypothetical protein [Desulfobulbaceae bacterium]